MLCKRASFPAITNQYITTSPDCGQKVTNNMFANIPEEKEQEKGNLANCRCGAGGALDTVAVIQVQTSARFIEVNKSPTGLLLN